MVSWTQTQTVRHLAPAQIFVFFETVVGHSHAPPPYDDGDELGP